MPRMSMTLATVSLTLCLGPVASAHTAETDDLPSLNQVELVKAIFLGEAEFTDVCIPTLSPVLREVLAFGAFSKDNLTTEVACIGTK